MSLVLALLAAPAFAQEPAEPEQKVIYRTETIIDIDDGLQIDAKVAKSEVGIVFVPTPPKGASLLHLRKDFAREMKQTVDAVK